MAVPGCGIFEVAEGTRDIKDMKFDVTKLELTECQWLAHDGQAPDEGES